MKVINYEKNLNFVPMVACIGLFDGIHLGHQKLIKEARKYANNNKLPLAIITFKNLYKGIRLLNDEEEQIILNSLEVDYVIYFDFSFEFKNMEAKNFILDVLNKMNLVSLFVGEDFHFGKDAKGDTFLLSTYLDKSIKLNVFELYKIDDVKVSSSLIRQFLKNGELKKVNQYLGYNYFLNVILKDNYFIVLNKEIQIKDGKYNVLVNGNNKELEVINNTIKILTNEKYLFVEFINEK